jgi:hypothetical protein
MTPRKYLQTPDIVLPAYVLNLAYTLFFPRCTGVKTQCLSGQDQQVHAQRDPSGKCHRRVTRELLVDLLLRPPLLRISFRDIWPRLNLLTLQRREREAWPILRFPARRLVLAFLAHCQMLGRRLISSS